MRRPRALAVPAVAAVLALAVPVAVVVGKPPGGGGGGGPGGSGDTTAPVVTLTAPAAGSSSTDATPTFSGAAGTAKNDQATIAVEVFSGGVATGTPARTLTASRSGSTWTVTAPTAFATGTYTAGARQRDKAGNTGFSSANTFDITAPPSPPPGDPRILAAGDIACDPSDSSYNGGAGTLQACRQLDTSNQLTGAGAARVLTLGDNAYEQGSLSQFRTSYDPTWGRVLGITSPAVGNHEYNTAGAAGYFDYFNGQGAQSGRAGERGKGYYSYDVGTWHLIALNSNCAQVGGCTAGSAQEQWLRTDLVAHPAACTLAYWHHPRFSSGEHGDTPGMAAIWQALVDRGADVVLSGHDHDYERFAPMDAAGLADAANGVRELVVGTGGKSHYAIAPPRANSEAQSDDTYGVLELTLHPAGYDWRFLPAVGSF